jgi:exodeoxyribonuclease-1
LATKQVNCSSRKGTRVFVFYDTETTGLDKDFTQILQVGMLFTDGDLNILSSKKVDGRNSPWNVPSPSALLTTHFTPANLKSRKNSNYDMMQELSAWLHSQHWPITFIGYNSVDYDEPVMAQNFYQNLLPPGLTTAYAGHGQTNGRADVMSMVNAVDLYMPGTLTLDIKSANGMPSKTLKNIARQNGVSLDDDDAHDALNDIKATVGVAKVVQTAAPKIWEQSIKLSTTLGVDKFLNDNQVFTWAKFYFGRPKSAVMTSVVKAKGTNKQVLFDLRVDPTPYLGMTAEQLKDVFLTKKAHANPFIAIKKDDQPILMPMDQSAAILTEKDDVALFEKRAADIKANAAFLENVAKAQQLAHAQQMAALPPRDNSLPETQKNKWMTPEAQSKLNDWSKQFREAATWHDRAVLTQNFSEYFKDELTADPTFDRFEKLASRLVFENAPEELPADQQLAIKQLIAKRLLDKNVDVHYMTIARARQEIKEIEASRGKPGGRWSEVTDSDIQKLKLFYTSMEKAYAPFAVQQPPSAPPHAQPPANNNDAPHAFVKASLKKAPALKLKH